MFNLPIEIQEVIYSYTNLKTLLKNKRLNFNNVFKYMYIDDDSYTINKASEYGHLEVVKYLHSIGKNCTADAMDEASKHGHLEVVEYLHSHTQWTRHLEMVTWKLSNFYIQ